MDKVASSFAILGVCLAIGAFCHRDAALAARTALPSKTDEQLKIEEMEAQAEKQEVKTPKPSLRDTAALIALLPEDATPRFSIRQLQITGNSLIPTATLLGHIPDVFNASPAKDPIAMFLYDLRPLKAVAARSGTAVDVSARSIQGFTQYLLGLYQKRNYAGIYVYVPAEAFEAGRELSQGILPIRILEAPVSAVSSSYFDVNNQPAEKTYLNPEFLRNWSPIQPGKVANRRDLDNYLNLLNRNPDRYVSAIVSQGEEPNSLAVEYRVYEANPWHFFVQVDNAGTKDIQWSPRFGLINTNLLGFDDRLTVIW